MLPNKHFAKYKIAEWFFAEKSCGMHYTPSALLRVLSILLRGFYFNEFPESHLKIKKWERMRRNESSGLTQVRLSGTVTVKTLTFQETNLG